MRRLVSFSTPLVAALMVTPFAFAAWITNGLGTGTGTATSVNAGNAPQPDWGDGTVLLTWDASTLASGAPVGYYDVIRDGNADAPVCSHVEGTGCIDENPLPGRVSYSVIPRIGANWMGPASEGTTFQYDVFPPTTSLSSRTPDANSAGWNKGDVVITLDATDPAPVASGVAAIHYVLDGVETVVTGDTATFTVAEEKVSTLKYWAVDELNNTEGATPTDDVKIDKTAPTTGFSVNPTPNAAGWNNTDVTVTLTPSDALSDVASTEYSLTGGANWTPYLSSGISITAEGMSSILYRSTDNAGNVEVPKTGTVKLDKTAPVSSASLTGSTVTLSAIETGSGLEAILYKIGSASTYTTYTSPFALASGQTASFHSVDKAGNLESPDKTFTNVPSDTTGPTITPAGPTQGGNYVVGNNGTNSWAAVCSTGKVCATVTDPSTVSSVTYRLVGTSGTLNNGKCWDGNAFITGTTCNVSMTGTGNSWAGANIGRSLMGVTDWSLTFTATDAVGNVSTSTITFKTS